MTQIATCLWFAREAEQAALFYASLLPDSRVEGVHRAPADYPGGRAGDVLTVDFVLCGARYLGLNGGDGQPYSWAASVMVTVDTQAEVDRLWSALTDGGKEIACGWLNDRWGVPWQIVPRRLTELMTGPDLPRAKRVMEAMMSMTKFNVAALESA